MDRGGPLAGASSAVVRRATRPGQRAEHHARAIRSAAHNPKVPVSCPMKAPCFENGTEAPRWIGKESTIRSPRWPPSAPRLPADDVYDRVLADICIDDDTDGLVQGWA